MDEAVALQKAAGLDVITDGEMRRLSFQIQWTQAVDGFGASSPPRAGPSNPRER